MQTFAELGLIKYTVAAFGGDLVRSLVEEIKPFSGKANGGDGVHLEQVGESTHTPRKIQAFPPHGRLCPRRRRDSFISLGVVRLLVS